MKNVKYVDNPVMLSIGCLVSYRIHIYQHDNHVYIRIVWNMLNTGVLELFGDCHLGDSVSVINLNLF